MNLSWKTNLKSHPLSNMMMNMLVILPTPISISNFWNFGSTLGLFLTIQLVTGLILASHYIPHSHLAFMSLDHISRNIEGGWYFRIFHLNGASFFFLFLYAHIGRGLYYKSYKFKETWNIGMIIYVLSMGIGFLGYVLPWGQMSFWGATVITNLISAIPICGDSIVNWLWGGFSVEKPTLNRFFMLHFSLPFILTGLVILHLFFLHTHGSSNPTMVGSENNLISFSPYFMFKDLTFFFITLIFYFLLILIFPYYLGDPENFILACPLITPTHIVPEWYFLFAYAILRSIPNKLGGVCFLGLSILIFFIPPFMMSVKKKKSNNFFYYKQFFFFFFIGIFFILTWLGGKPVEEPFIFLGQLFLLLYFFLFFSISF